MYLTNCIVHTEHRVPRLVISQQLKYSMYIALHADHLEKLLHKMIPVFHSTFIRNEAILLANRNDVSHYMYIYDRMIKNAVHSWKMHGRYG